MLSDARIQQKKNINTKFRHEAATRTLEVSQETTEDKLLLVIEEL
jgi:hypothetical protein